MYVFLYVYQSNAVVVMICNRCKICIYMYSCMYKSNAVVVIRIPDIPHSTLAPTHTITQSQTISIQIRNSQMVITEAQSRETTFDGFKIVLGLLQKLMAVKTNIIKRFKAAEIEQLLLLSQWIGSKKVQLMQKMRQWLQFWSLPHCTL